VASYRRRLDKGGSVKARSKLVAFIAVLPLLAAACSGGGKPKQTHTASPFPRGGTLHVGLFRWSANFPYDPTSTLDNGWLYPCCLLRTLYYYNGRPSSEGGGVLRPDLATTLPELSADGLTWTVHIRAGLHYGPPLQNVEITSRDFIRAIQRLLSPAPKQFQGATGPTLGGNAGYFQQILQGAQDYSEGKADAVSGLEAPDPHTLRLHLTEQSGDLPYLLSLTATAPIPPNPFNPQAKFGVAEGHAADGYGRFLVSTGPYMIEGSGSLDFSKPPDQQQPASGLDPLVFVRNPSWQPSSDPLRPAYPDRIEFTAYSDTPYTPGECFCPDKDKLQDYRTTWSTKVETGELDVLDWPTTTEVVKRYETDPALKSQLQVNEFNSVRFLAMNVAEPPFDDIHVRRAVNYVIDKQGLLQAWLAGHNVAGQAVYDHLAPDVDEDNLLVNYRPYPSPNHAGDVAAAEQEMQQSAYDRNHDGRCDQAACNLGTVLWRNDGAYPAILQVIKQGLAKIGIVFKPKIVDGSVMYQGCSDPAAHTSMCPVGWGADFPSASTFFPPLYSTDALAGGSNYSLVGAKPEQLRAWHYQVASVPNLDPRMTACRALVRIAQVQCWVAFDQYLMEQVVPAVPMLVDLSPWIFSSRVASFSFDQVGATPALSLIALKAQS
jgi:peptide/nickel transport system substrate-binding protein